jgi:hypothetical protein
MFGAGLCGGGIESLPVRVVLACELAVLVLRKDEPEARLENWTPEERFWGLGADCIEDDERLGDLSIA